MTGSLAGLLPLSVLEPDGLIVTTDGSVCAADRVRAGTQRADGRSGHARGDRAGVRERVPDDPRSPGNRRLRADGSRPAQRGARGRPGAHAGGRRRRSRCGSSRACRVSRAAARSDDPDRAGRSRRRAARCRGALVGRGPILATARDSARPAAFARGAIQGPDAVVDASRGGDRERARERTDRGCAARAPGSRPIRWTARKRWRCCGSGCTPRPIASAIWIGSPRPAASRPRRRSRRHATRVTRSLLAACDGAECGIDAGEDAGWLRHADGTLEEVLHLGSPPAYTDASWLSHLLCCPLPATLAVHIAVGGRAREQARQRRRWKRLRAAVLYKERRDRVVGSDEQEALEEAASVDAELAAEIGASVYRVGIYCSIRDPQGRLEYFKRTVKQTAERVPRAHQRPGDPRAAALPSGLHLDAADRRRRRCGRLAATRSGTSLTASR